MYFKRQKSRKCQKYVFWGNYGIYLLQYLWSLYSHVMLHTAQERKYSLLPQAQKYNHSLHFQLQTGEIIAFISPKCNVVIACSWHVQLQLKAFISCNLQLAAHSLQQCIFFVGDVCVLLCQQPQILEKCCATLPCHQHVRTLYGDVLSTWPVCTMTPRSWHLFPTYNFALGLQMSCHRISPTHDLDWHPVIVSVKVAML